MTHGCITGTETMVDIDGQNRPEKYHKNTNFRVSHGFILISARISNFTSYDIRDKIIIHPPPHNTHIYTHTPHPCPMLCLTCDFLFMMGFNLINGKKIIAAAGSPCTPHILVICVLLNSNDVSESHQHIGFQN